MGASRVVVGNTHKYSVRESQVADFLVGIKGMANYHVIYLPAQYHSQHPNFFHTKITAVKQQMRAQDKLLVVTLTENT